MKRETGNALLAKVQASTNTAKPTKGRRTLAQIAAVANATRAKVAHDNLGAEAAKWAMRLYKVKLYRTESQAVVFKNERGEWRKRHSGLCKGWLDYTAVIHPTGRVLFVDTKTGKQTKKKNSGLNPDQKRFRDEVIQAGAAVIVLTDLSQFLADLGALIDDENRKGLVPF